MAEQTPPVTRIVQHNPKKHKPLPVAPENKPLTATQQRVVDLFMETGATMTDMAKTLNMQRSSVSQIMHRPNVEKILADHIGHSIRISAVGAIRTLTQLSQSAKSDYVKLQASDSILDRAGFKPPDRTEVDVSGELSIVIDLS